MLFAVTAITFAACLAPAAARAQAVWNNADSRDYDGNGTFVAAYWSYGYEPANSATGFKGYVGNWSGNPYPGTGGVADAYLGAPGNTLCDVQVTLSTMTIASVGQLTMTGSSSLSVGSTDIQGDGELIDGMSGGGFPIFNNTGTFRKSAGTGTYSIDSFIVFNSLPGSVIQVDSGTLQLPGAVGLLDTVTFNTAAGTVVDLVGDRGEFGFNFVQGTLSSGTGVGTVRMRANQLDYNYHQDGASCTFNFPGDVFQWTGGIIGGTGSGEVPLFYNTGVMNLSGDGTKFSEAFITNQNLMIQTGAGNLDIGGVDILTNAAGATYDLRSDAGIVTTGYGVIANAALFKKSAGTGTSTINTFFHHLGGTVEVDSGTLLLPTSNNTGTTISTGGTFNVAANALLDLGSGEIFGGTYTGSGAGTVRFSAGILNGDDNNVHPTVFNFPAGLFQWTGGTIGDYPLEIFTNAGTMTLAGDAAKGFNTVVTNTGSFIHTGTGNLNIVSNAPFTNAAGAVYDLRSDAGIVSGDNTSFPLTNAGTFQKSGGTGNSSIDKDLSNTGTVSAATGTLTFVDQIVQVSNSTLTGGTWNVGNGATLAFSNYPNGFMVNQATVTLNGPNASFPAFSNLTDNQGNLSLLGQQSLTTAGDLSNEGTITLDAGSTLHVAGNFTASDAAASTSAAHQGGVHTQAATASTLSFVVGGTAAQGALSPGVLQVAGAAKMAGLIEIALSQLAATPNVTDSVVLVSAQSVTGTFDNAPDGTRLATTDGRGSYVVNYGATAIGLSRFLAPGQTETTPVVTVAVVGDGDAVEGGENGKVAIRRAGDITSALTVRYKVTGGVVAGVDYKALPGVAVIPAGASQVKIKIKPIDDSVVEGTRIAKVKLKPATDGSYALGSVVAAKVHILDND